MSMISYSKWFNATHENNVPKLRAFIKDNPDFNVEEKDKNGNTALIVACGWRHMQVAEILVKELSANVNCTGQHNNSPLTANSYYLPLVEMLVKYGADVNHSNEFGFTPILLTDKLDSIEYLVGHGADINYCTEKGWNLLIKASRNCDLDIIKYAIKMGLDINHKTKDSGNTPLIEASNFDLNLSKSIKAVRFLLLCGADTTIQNNEGKTAIEVARDEEIKELIKEWTFEGGDI